MSENLQGLIFNIQRYSIEDGDGIRTLIFMKGCPLKCVWCSNPESHSNNIQLMYIKTNCRKCGKCLSICPQTAIDPITLAIDKSRCVLCGKCAEQCFSNAKKIVGKSMTVDECMDVIDKDRIFYDNSDGGVTIGGGEPLMQSGFVSQLLKRCQNSLIHTTVETSGYGNWENIRSVFEYTDHALYDIKCMDTVRHKEYTGVGNENILNNAKLLAAMKKKITFRIPLIPNHNDDDDNITETGKFILSLMEINKNISMELLPYHKFGVDKYEWLGIEYMLNNCGNIGSYKKHEFESKLREMGICVKE